MFDNTAFINAHEALDQLALINEAFDADADDAIFQARCEIDDAEFEAWRKHCDKKYSEDCMRMEKDFQERAEKARERMAISFAEKKAQLDKQWEESEKAFMAAFGF